MSIYIVQLRKKTFNPLDFKGSYGAKSNNTKLVYWPLMGGLLHLVQREKGPGQAAAPPSPLIAVPNLLQRTHQRPVYQSLYRCMMVRCCAVLMWLLKR